MKKSMDVLAQAFQVLHLPELVPMPVPQATVQPTQVHQTKENFSIPYMNLKLQMRPCYLRSEVKSSESFIHQTMNGVTLRTDIMEKVM